VGPAVANAKGPEQVWAGPSAADGERPVAAATVRAGEIWAARAVRRVHPALRMAMSLPEAGRGAARQAARGRLPRQVPYI